MSLGPARAPFSPKEPRPLSADIPLTVINQALFELGSEPVSDLSDSTLETSLAAVKLLRVVEASRDIVLRRHGWTCALEYVTLAPAVIAGNYRYPTVFLLPGNALRVWEIDGVCIGIPGTDWPQRWQMGTIEDGAAARQIIRAAGSPASLDVAYVRRAVWAAIEPHVLDAIAYDLAARGCYAVTGDLGQAKKLLGQAEQKAIAAVSVDGTQEGGQPALGPSIPAALRAYSR